MDTRRVGVLVCGAIGVVAVIAFVVGWVRMAMGLVAVLAWGVCAVGLRVPRPIGGRATAAGLGLAGLGLAAFILAAGVMEAHLSVGPLGVQLLLVVLFGIIATVIGAAAVAVATIGHMFLSREHHLRRGFAAVLGAVVLVGLGGYSTYAGVVGSDSFLRPVPNADCRTPSVQFGWAYEAINYDIADDAALLARSPNPRKCADQGATAGNAVVTSDGVRIAGWYIPAASGIGPTGPTVILVHGWNANKSEVLRYGVSLHQAFNLVAFDLRGGGRSSPVDVTFGVREKLDLEAIVDWLARTKDPVHIAVMGNSMGGGTAVLAAAQDPRIEALILDSTHAHVAEVVDRRVEYEMGVPAEPAMPAVFAGFWLRSGVDLMDADPVNAIATLGDRPVLIVHGTADANDIPDRSADLLARAAHDAGVPVAVRMCEGGTHGKVVDTCPAQWGQWAVAFLNDALGIPD